MWRLAEDLLINVFFPYHTEITEYILLLNVLFLFSSDLVVFGVCNMEEFVLLQPNKYAFSRCRTY